MMMSIKEPEEVAITISLVTTPPPIDGLKNEIS